MAALAGRVMYICNFPESCTVKDAIELMATFGDIVRAQVSKETEVVNLLPPRRRRPTLPANLRETGQPTSGTTALIEYEETQDAMMAAENIDGAVFFGHELVAGLTRKT